MIWLIFVCVCNIAIWLLFLLTCFYRMSVLWIVTISCSKEKLAMKRTFWRAHRLPRNTVQWNYAKNKYYKLSDRNTRTQRSGQWTQHTGLGWESVSQDWGVKEFSSCIHPTTAVIVRRAWSDCEQNPDILISGDGWHIRYSGDCSSGVQRSVAEVPESDKDSAAESPGECWMIPVNPNPPSYMLVSLAGVGCLSSARYCWNTILNLSGYFIVTVLTQTPLLCAVLDNYVDIYISRTQIECGTAAAKVQSYIFTTIPAVAIQ